MVTGYTFILCAALCWGVSATWARHLILTEQADALLLSQSRVFFAWVFLALGLVIFNAKHLPWYLEHYFLLRFLESEWLAPIISYIKQLAK